MLEVAYYFIINEMYIIDVHVAVLLWLEAQVLRQRTVINHI